MAGNPQMFVEELKKAIIWNRNNQNKHPWKLFISLK
jgi:hypothetical protein